jgi:membrane fusion protein (multidrug efflux system)
LKRFFILVAGILLLPPALAAQEAPIPAQLVAFQHTSLSAELPAKIDRITVKEGERFKAGQVLVAFDCSIQKAVLDEARAVLAAADKTKAAHKRLLELNSTGSLEMENAISDAAVAQAKANSAQAVVSKCTITAPFGGRVAERKAQAHQYVQAGQALLDILDDSALDAEFIIPSALAPKLKAGRGVEILVDETGKAYPARIARLGAKADPVSHSVKVIAEIKGEFPDLMAGMTGKVRMAR